MTEFLITYFGGNHPDTEAEGQQHFARYQAWLQGLGDAVLSPMNPLRGTTTVSADGVVKAGSQSGMSGYTVVQAETLEEAVKMAQSCPFLDIGGTLEVAERVVMSG